MPGARNSGSGSPGYLGDNPTRRKSLAKEVGSSDFGRSASGGALKIGRSQSTSWRVTGFVWADGSEAVWG